MKEETIVLHAGHRRDETTTSVAVPIYQTTYISLITLNMHQSYSRFKSLEIFILES